MEAVVLGGESLLLHVLVDELHRVLCIDKAGKVLLHQTLHSLIPLLAGLLQMLDTTEEVGEAGIPVHIAEEVPRMEVGRADAQRA